MSTIPTIHILRSPENDIVLTHAHDEGSYTFLTMLYDSRFGQYRGIWHEQMFFPLEKADHLVQMAKFEGITVIEGPECL